MKYLKKFQDEAAYQAFTESGEERSISRIPISPVATPQRLYKTNMDDFPGATDLVDYFQYDGTTEVDGTLYYKWTKYENDEKVGYYILTLSNDFSSASLANPIAPDGWYDSNGEVYDSRARVDFIVSDGTFYEGMPDPKIYFPNVSYISSMDTTIYNESSMPFEAIDLGLSVKWGNMNLGAKTVFEPGKYFRWADPIGAYVTSSSDITVPYIWENAPYIDDPNSYTWTKYTGSDYSTLQPEDDAVIHASLDSGWRMPTKEDFDELLDDTKVSHEVIQTATGIRYMKFTSLLNNNYILVPLSGYCGESSLDNVGTNFYLWSSSLGSDNSNYAWFLDGSSNGVVNVNDSCRYYGFAVRPVLEFT